MKKPTNIFVAIFAVIAIAAMAVDLAVFLNAKVVWQISDSPAENDRVALLLWQIAKSVLLVGGQFLAVAVIVAILDSIRWTLTPPEQRPALRRKYVFDWISRLRRAGAAAEGQAEIASRQTH